MANSETKTQLLEEVARLNKRVARLQHSLGTVRREIMTVKFPSTHRETMDRVMDIVDKVINES